VPAAFFTLDPNVHQSIAFEQKKTSYQAKAESVFTCSSSNIKSEPGVLLTFTARPSQTLPWVTPFACSLGSRQTATQHQKITHPARTTSLAMASPNGVLSPPAPSELATSSISLLAKRKRDDAIDVQNGAFESKSIATPGMLKEDSQALIRDLIDVLKGYVPTSSLHIRCEIK
jgi:hypothetical protein